MRIRLESMFSLSLVFICMGVDLPAQFDENLLIKRYAIHYDREVYGESFGHCAAEVGDLDQDGLPDFVVGSPHGLHLSDLGAVYTFSGKTGDLIFSVFAKERGDGFGSTVAPAGDMDGDGVSDFWVGAPRATIQNTSFLGSVALVSGATGQVVRTLSGAGFGECLGSLDDLDGDGFKDLAVSYYMGGWRGVWYGRHVIQIVSGRTGQRIRFLFPPSGCNYREFKVVEDFDGDGYRDLMTSNSDAYYIACGRVYVLSARTGVLIRKYEEDPTNTLAGVFGHSYDCLGDVDGDGFPEVLVESLGNGVGPNVTFVLSGATGSLIRRYVNYAYDPTVVGLGDIDGDGFKDFACSDYLGFSLNVHSGATGLVIQRTDIYKSLWPMSDLDGDGRSDCLGGWWWSEIVAYSANPTLTTSSDAISIAAGGTVDLSLDFPNWLQGSDYLVLLSATGMGPTMVGRLPIPLSLDSLFIASAQGITPPQCLGFQGTLGKDGQADAWIVVAPGGLPASAVGRTLYLAAVADHFSFGSVARMVTFNP
ncbi:MAG: hypothetical protein D6681_09425 [Calditrichaeota bacterium]|nr:MAG: hypothetical protein D6681_09425 [Calditrichota bacterium]